MLICGVDVFLNRGDTPEIGTFFQLTKRYCATGLQATLRNGSFPTELLFLYSAWQVIDYTAMAVAESVFQCLGSDVAGAMPKPCRK